MHFLPRALPRSSAEGVSQLQSGWSTAAAAASLGRENRLSSDACCTGMCALQGSFSPQASSSSKQDSTLHEHP